MRWWIPTVCCLVVVGLAVAQDEDKSAKPKDAPKAKKKADSDTVDLDVGAADNPFAKKAIDPKEMMKKVSYSIGAQVGKGMRVQNIELVTSEFIKGLEDALGEKDLALSDKEMQEVFLAFGKHQQTLAKAQAAKAQKAGEELLETNKTKEGVKVLPSGLQYKVLASGKGASPKASDTVRAHYRGKTVDGKTFDESYTGEAPKKNEQPRPFAVNRVIPGWTEALQKMKPGDKWQLVIPSKLAYGPGGQPDAGIAPNSVLIFDVELVEVVE